MSPRGRDVAEAFDAVDMAVGEINAKIAAIKPSSTVVTNTIQAPSGSSGSAANPSYQAPSTPYIPPGNPPFGGQATIPAGQTSVAVSFSTPQTGNGQPIIVITPTSEAVDYGIPAGSWVNYTGTPGAWTGFTIGMSEIINADVTFNYIVIGQP